MIPRHLRLRTRTASSSLAFHHHHLRISNASRSSSSASLHTTTSSRASSSNKPGSGGASEIGLGLERQQGERAVGDGRDQDDSIGGTGDDVRPTFFTGNSTLSGIVQPSPPPASSSPPPSASHASATPNYPPTSSSNNRGRARSPAFSRPSFLKLGNTCNNGVDHRSASTRDGPPGGIGPGSGSGSPWGRCAQGDARGGQDHDGVDGSSGPLSSGSSSGNPILPPSFAERYYYPPQPVTGTPDHYTLSLASHLRVSFLPHHTAPHPSSSTSTNTSRLRAASSPSASTPSEPLTLALVCPLEGSESHTLLTTLSAASLLGADVVELDAVKSLGLGAYGVLGTKAGEGVRLGRGNPVLVRDESVVSGGSGAGGAGLGEGEEGVDELDVREEDDGQEDEHEHEGEEGEEGEMDEGEMEDGQQVGAPGGAGGFPTISGPFEIAIPIGSGGGGGGGIGGGQGGGGARMGLGGSSSSTGGIGFEEPREVGSERDKEMLGRVFRELVDLPRKHTSSTSSTPSGPQPRIILVSRATAMSSSFSTWWWALTNAVKARNARGEPTTIVLSLTPSFLHLGPNLSLPPPKPPVEAAENPGLPPGLGELVKAMKRMREASSGAGGQGGQGGKREDEAWKGSEEDDKVGRKKRLRRRLASFQLGDERALRRFLPLFDDVEGLPAHLPMEAKEGIIRMRGNHRSVPKIWRVVGTLPNERDESAEKQERYAERLELNRLLLKKAVGKHGLTFTDVALGDELNSDNPPHSDEVQEEFQDLRNSFATTVWPWTTLQHLATIGVGHALSTRASKGGEDSAGFTVTWQDLAEASVIESHAETALEKWKESQKVSPVVQSAVVQPHPRSGRKSKSDASPKKTIDPLVEKLKKDKTLNAHERRLLSCIVDHGAVKNTSFDDVAMEDKTKDAVRSTISLPLLYPEAFRTGILAQHASQGVLLYGPPGTGKTHLSRALANESGSRMIAVTPADINDMYVGQSEARTKALFSLSRRLSPCIIFIDEAESLLGSRGGLSSGNAAHRQVLTEFMQEMDGLTSAGSNREARVSVVAATNRPFDMDEAVLRRLPRRLLIDLPTLKDREVILKILLKNEQLAPDVDLAKLAKDTDTYSGSDLKHVCVSAAMDALKELAPPPWALARQTLGLETAAASSSSSASGCNGYDGPPGGGGGSTALEIEVDEMEQGAGGPEVMPLSPVAAGDQVVTMKTREDSGESEQLGKAESSVGSSSVGPSSNAAPSGSAPPPAESNGPASTTDKAKNTHTNPASPLPPNLPPRILHLRHFTQALGEISPSSAEGASLEELRKWASKFGEGGTERGKKGGYGAKFGFGEVGEEGGKKGAVEEEEYGRVRPGK